MSAVEKESPILNWGLLGTLLVVIAAVAWVGVRILFPDTPTMFAGTVPSNLGVVNGHLTPCPSSPNCVSTQSSDAEHHIEPLNYDSSTDEAIAELKNIIISQPRAKLITEDDNYLYAQFTSKWMGFVDDVEFFANRDTGAIEARSASRLGESDLGVNLARINHIREQFNTASL